MSVRILVTGANGFLGRRVVAALQRRGHAVRALVRPATAIDPARLGWGDDVEVVRGDLRATAIAELAQAFDGVDGLVHLAAAVTGGEDAQFAAGVVGTERLLDAMARTATRRRGPPRRSGGDSTSATAAPTSPVGRRSPDCEPYKENWSCGCPGCCGSTNRCR